MPARRKTSPARRPAAISRAKAATRSKPLAQTRVSRAPEPESPLCDLHAVGTARQLFWSNVLKEILASLCVASARFAEDAARRPAPPAPGADGGTAELTGDQLDAARIFDGRLAIITTWGARIPVGAISPVMNASSARGGARALAQAVEWTVFQIRTPEGDVWTLPLHEIRAFHSLTEQLMQDLQAAAREEQDDAGEGEGSTPFGFKAFTSLARLQPAPPSGPGTPDFLGE